MAKEQFNVTLPTEVVAMVAPLCKTDRGDVSNSALVEKLIRDAYTKIAPAKRVEPVYEMIGRRKKLVGFDAWYGDDLIDTRDTRAAAQAALDAHVYEELSK